MTQDEINQAEWNNRGNWSLFFYHSPRDTRMWVPKRCGFGWTINLRNKGGVAVFVILMATLVITAITLITLRPVLHWW